MIILEFTRINEKSISAVTYNFSVCYQLKLGISNSVISSLPLFRTNTYIAISLGFPLVFLPNLLRLFRTRLFRTPRYF